MFPFVTEKTMAAGETPCSVSRIVGGTAAVIFTLMMASAMILWSSYRDTVGQQETALHNLSIAFSAQTFSAVQSIDLALAEVQRKYIRAEDLSKNRYPTTHLDLQFDNPTHSGLLGIFLCDTKQRLLALVSVQSATSGSDLTATIPPPSNISGLQSMRIDAHGSDTKTGHPILHFSRFLFDVSGNVIGTITAIVDATAFQHLYQSVRLGTGGSLTLESMSGATLVHAISSHVAGNATTSMEPISATSFLLPQRTVEDSRADANNRLYSYSTVDNYPLTVVTSIDKDQVLGLWYRHLYTSVLSLMVAILLVLFLAWRASSDARRQQLLIGHLASSEGRLEKSANYLHTILNSIGNPICVLDRHCRFVLMNNAFMQLAGTQTEILEFFVDTGFFQSPEKIILNSLFAQVFEGGENIVTESQITDSEGKQRAVLVSISKLIAADGNHQIISSLTDMSEQKETLDRLAYLADFDLLTGLPNHAFFSRILKEELSKPRQIGWHIGVLTVSLGRLQEIAELLGHEARDIAINAAGDMLKSFVHDTIFTARVKTNEFSILLSYRGSRRMLKSFADDLYAVLAEPVAVLGRSFYLGPVIGAAVYPEDAATAGELLRLADVAKHHASLDGREAIHLFSKNKHVALD